jgi:hypothetical protein
MNKYILTLSGSLGLEYNECGSKNFDVVINLPNNLKFHTRYQVHMSWKDIENYKDPYYIIISNYTNLKTVQTKEEVFEYISSILVSDGWKLEIETPLAFEI